MRDMTSDSPTLTPPEDPTAPLPAESTIVPEPAAAATEEQTDQPAQCGVLVVGHDVCVDAKGHDGPHRTIDGWTSVNTRR